eukprot:434619-Pelagomonas_calceolata.AAC.3
MMPLGFHLKIVTGEALVQGLQGVGLQPKNLADRLQKSIDIKIRQNTEARQERNKVSVSFISVSQGGTFSLRSENTPHINEGKEDT